MHQPQDILGFDPNEYVRPGDAWVCGGAADGLPCPRGPTPDGMCGAVCTPYRDGSRFFCASPSLLTGACDDGPCEDGACSQDPPQCAPVQRGGQYLCTRGSCPSGPNPDGSCARTLFVCRPVRTVMSRRRIASLSAFALALAAVAILLGGPSRRAAVSPGQVSASHLAIADDCSACHEQGDGTAIDWIEAAAAGHSLASQNNLCLECHGELAEHAVSPHGMSPSALCEITDQTASRREGPPMVRLANSVMPLPNELNCALCHQEHHGVDHDLQALADAQCQVCHQRTFHSFDSGHPSFTEYPFDRRTRIRFDHATHYGVHFSNFARMMPSGVPPGDDAEIASAASTTCMHCHAQDASGAFMGVRDFETMCASCHEPQIAEDDPAVTPPIPVFSLAGFAPGRDGPQSPSEDTAHPFPPIMQLLLSADPDFRQVYASSAGYDPFSSEAVWPADPAARISLIEATGRLLQELAAAPIESFQRRLQQALRNEAAEAAMSASAQFRSSGFAEGLRALTSAMEPIREPVSENEEVDSSNAPETAGQNPDGQFVRQLGWSYHPDTRTLSYTPHGHADPFVRAWIDLAVNYAAPAALTSGGDAGDRDVAGQAADRLLEFFARSASAGRCIKCHTIDAGSAGSRLSVAGAPSRFHVNWRALQPSSRHSDFTRFSHGPHVVMLSTGDECKSCHELEEQVEFDRPEFLLSGGLVRTNPLAPACAGIRQLSSTQSCVRCHRQEGASQRCTTCHNYHVGANSHGG